MVFNGGGMFMEGCFSFGCIRKGCSRKDFAATERAKVLVKGAETFTEHFFRVV